MLKFFNRLERTRNFVLFLFAILMVLGLVLFYTPVRNQYQANLSHSDETAATVGGEKITVGEIIRQKERYGQMMQGRSYPTKSVVEGLIGERVGRIEAARYDLTASDKEVADDIRKQIRSDDPSKAIDQDLYQQNVIESYGSIPAYEQSVRDNLSYKKLDAYITSGVTVSEEDVLKDFQRKNTKFELTYAAVSATDLAKTITPSDQDLRDYFEKNKASYYISVPQKKVRYLFINTSKIGEKLQISDAELKTEFDSLPEDKKSAGVLGQEIVLRIPKPDMDADVEQKAADLVSQLRAEGPTVTQEAFANMAKGHSENPATAAKGGALAGPVRENTAKTDDPYQRLLKMKPGEITDPISYQGRYFILRRGESVPKTFETAKKELEVSLRNRKAYTIAAELAQKVADSLKQSKDVQKTAAEYASQANMSVAEMVRETGYIKPGDDVPNIGVSPQFEDGIKPLENANDVGDKTPVKDGFAIPMLVDKKDPRDADFDEVKGQLVEAVKVEKARSQVEGIADAIAAAAPNAAALAAAAKGKGLSTKDQKNFVLGSPIGEGPTAGTNDEIEDALFAMKAGDVTKKPVKIGESYYIIGVTKREDADNGDFAKQRSNLLDQMLSTKQNAVFADYMATARRKLESGGYIKVYQEALDKVDANEPAEPPEQQIPGRPPQGKQPS
jgi:peptidyl-prolyl cis-trans isomerase D